ncbi:MAG: hypothetical protein IT316_14330 [Anaerolineales bacterium]|nr:hypothetical protein [Anaerolineales bacterium]
MNPPTCPVFDDVSQIQARSKDLVRTMRKLRRDLRACESCPSCERCAILAAYQANVQSALDQLTEEWNLAATQEA